MREEKVVISSAGIQLEGLMGINEALSFKGGMVLCHPHPLYGGNMHNPVIASTAETASLEGFITLRFNFRGVGASEGSYGEGIAEQEDVKAAVEFLSSKIDEPDSLLILLGYSFGAWTGLQVAVKDARIKGMIAIAPPLQIYDFGFLKGSPKKKLIIVGERDDFCPLSKAEEWSPLLEEPKTLAVIEEADHFFSSRHRSLIEPLRDFLKTF
jgi:uncharacterized protein